MSLLSELDARCGSQCELCGNTNELSAWIVSPKIGDVTDEQVAVCSTCREQIETPESIDPDHWRCLNDSMWSPVPAVQVMAFRMLKSMPNESWTADLLNMMYMDEETREWAEQGSSENQIQHVDSNGQVLETGDTVVLIKDLNVKGANFTAKRGTAVRRITLVRDNPEQIEGRVNDQHIVILTQYVKKS